MPTKTISPITLTELAPRDPLEDAHDDGDAADPPFGRFWSSRTVVKADALTFQQ